MPLDDLGRLPRSAESVVAVGLKTTYGGVTRKHRKGLVARILSNGPAREWHREQRLRQDMRNAKIDLHVSTAEHLDIAHDPFPGGVVLGAALGRSRHQPLGQIKRRRSAGSWRRPKRQRVAVFAARKQ